MLKFVGVCECICGWCLFIYLFIYLCYRNYLFIFLSLLLRMKELSFVFHFSNFFMSNILNGFSQTQQHTSIQHTTTTTEKCLMWIIVRKWKIMTFVTNKKSCCQIYFTNFLLLEIRLFIIILGNLFKNGKLSVWKKQEIYR